MIKMDYSKSKIYIIRNKINDDTYIGATIQELPHHLLKQYEISREPKRASFPLTIAFKEHGYENFYIELLEAFPCDKLKQLNKRKGEIIKDLNPTLNTFKFMTRYEREKMYKKADPEKYKAWSQKYYQKNKEKLLEKAKDYRNTHKHELHEKRIQTVECSCGRTVQKRELAKHCKTNVHAQQSNT
jgi:hypothetical protein